MDFRPRIVYEDDDLLALEKPPGALVEGVEDGERTLTDWASEICGWSARPLHRLDRETTGLVLFAKNSRWNSQLSALFEKRRIRKEYWVIVRGQWDRTRRIVETHIRALGGGRFECHDDDGKPSRTTFRPLEVAPSHSWMQALPKTGRTHQIRLHCAYAGCPIAGDRLYSEDSAGPLLLHARSLRFPHPNGSGIIALEAEPPGYWAKWIEPLGRLD